MGAQASKLEPGIEFQIIGADLSRTGTASSSEALRIILDGTIYHGGTQAIMGPFSEIKTLIKILTNTFYLPNPAQPPTRKKLGKSMEDITSVSTLRFLNFVLFPLPEMRHFPDYTNKLREQWMTLYGDAGHEPHTVETYERHIRWQKNVVPEEKLVFFNVQEDWSSLGSMMGRRLKGWRR